jgi:hypothetical protein
MIFLELMPFLLKFFPVNQLLKNLQYAKANEIFILTLPNKSNLIIFNQIKQKRLMPF